MLSTIATIVSMLNSGLSFILNLLGLKKSGSDNSQDAATQAVKMSNEAGRESADVMRQTAQETNKELSNADNESAHDHWLMQSAGSLRDAQTAVNDAITSANKDANTDR